MSRPTQLISEHFRRQRPLPGAPDAAYMLQVNILRDLLERLDEILEDMGTPEEARAHITRCMLYGYPSRADMELRVDATERYRSVAQQMTTPSMLTPRSTL